VIDVAILILLKVYVRTVEGLATLIQQIVDFRGFGMDYEIPVYSSGIPVDSSSLHSVSHRLIVDLIVADCMAKYGMG
jgi:hypothetical protein